MSAPERIWNKWLDIHDWGLKTNVLGNFLDFFLGGEGRIVVSLDPSRLSFENPALYICERYSLVT